MRWPKAIKTDKYKGWIPMAFRSFLAGSALALSLVACSGGGEDTADTGADTTAMSAPADAAPDSAAATQEGATDASAEATPTAEAAKPTPTATPSATPIKAAAAPASAPMAAVVAPAAFGRCAICHTADKGGEDKLGPNLWGVYGKKAGQGSFAFSDALRNSGLTLDDATLNAWLENPRALVPGNRMSFPGLKDAAKRQEIIDYLKKQR